MTGAELISEERKRQIEVEGYDKEHDADEYYHDVDAFVKAAVSYSIIDLKDSQENYAYAWWPWNETSWKPKDRLRNLVRAGALIAAAIDKLNKDNNNDR